MTSKSSSGANFSIGQNIAQLLHHPKMFVGSMSRKGNCWDNTVVERFFGSLKQKRVQWISYQTRSETPEIDLKKVF